MYSKINTIVLCPELGFLCARHCHQLFGLIFNAAYFVWLPRGWTRADFLGPRGKLRQPSLVVKQYPIGSWLRGTSGKATLMHNHNPLTAALKES